MDNYLTLATFITLICDNNVNNYLKEMLAFIYYGSVVNNRPKNFHYAKIRETFYGSHRHLSTVAVKSNETYEGCP